MNDSSHQPHHAVPRRIRLHRALWIVPALAVTFAAVWASGEQDHGNTESAPAPLSAVFRREFGPYGRIDSDRLRECSGLVASRRHPGVYWAHNDSGNPTELFAIDDHGRLLGMWRVSGAPNVDWEDAALEVRPDADCDRLVIADIGDNKAKRRSVQLVFVDEPADPRAGGDLPVVRTQPFTYAGGPRNAEALVMLPAVTGVPPQIIEKLDLQRLPGLAAAKVFRLGAGLKESDPPTSARSFESYTFAGPVTCAATTADGRWLAVGTYVAVYVFERTRSDGPLIQGIPTVTPIACEQMEAISFHHDGSGDLLLANEQRQIFRLTREWQRSGKPFGAGSRLTPSGESSAGGPAAGQAPPPATQPTS